MDGNLQQHRLKGIDLAGRDLRVDAPSALLVHVDCADVPAGLRLLAFELPDDGVVDLAPLPAGWQSLPYSAAVQTAGDQWVRAGKSLALRVPSAVARGQHNVLVNPAHKRFSELRRASNDPLAFDTRLFAH